MRVCNFFKLNIACGLILAAAGAAGASQAERISRVVVYPDRAQVSRIASVSCGERALVHFTGLPPAADAASLRAQTSVGRVEGVRSEEHALSAAYAKGREALDEKLHQLELELQALREQQSRDDSANQLALRYSSAAQTLINRELIEPQGAQGAPGPRSWSTALDTSLQIQLQVAAARAERAAKQRELERKQEELRRQQQRQQAAAERRELSADVLISCPPGQTASVELSYVVGGAGWVPAHEARLLDGDGQGGGVVMLTSYATVTQSTGEDWQAAQLTLSTAVPRQNATPPAISALRVYADPREPPKKKVVSREELTEHAEAPAAGADSKDASDGRQLQRKDQGLSVQFVVAHPADIPGDGTPSRLVIAQSRLAARLAYRTVPKLLPYVFRVAELTNSSGYPLLPGALDAFRKGQFLARYELAHVANGARFQLTFGLEDRLKVKRAVVEELATDRGVFGSTRRHRFVYRFEIANYLDHQDDLELAEHIPVSELDDIKVSLAPQTSSGHQLNSEDGIVTWRVPLRSGEKRVLSLAYFVDVPSSYTD